MSDSSDIPASLNEVPRLNIVLDVPAEETAVSAATLLLVDDKPANIVALEAVLNSPAYRIISASSGLDALAVLEQEEVALILLDIQMPGIDGYETARRIKANERWKDIPIIFVTAIYREDPHIRKGYEAGAVDYLGKPFDVEVLQKKVGIYTKIYHQRNELLRNQDQHAKIEAVLRARNEELEHNSAERTTVLETVSDAVYVGRGRRISDWNRAALDLFGFESQDEINRDLTSFSNKIFIREVETGRPIPLEEQPYFRALRGERSSGRFLIRNVKTGADHVIESAASPVFFRNEVIGVVWSVNEEP